MGRKPKQEKLDIKVEVERGRKGSAGFLETKGSQNRCD